VIKLNRDININGNQNNTGKILHLDAVCFIIYMIRFMWFIKNKIKKNAYQINSARMLMYCYQVDV